MKRFFMKTKMLGLITGMLMTQIGGVAVSGALEPDPLSVLSTEGVELSTAEQEALLELKGQLRESTASEVLLEPDPLSALETQAVALSPEEQELLVERKRQLRERIARATRNDPQSPAGLSSVVGRGTELLDETSFPSPPGAFIIHRNNLNPPHPEPEHPGRTCSRQQRGTRPGHGQLRPFRVLDQRRGHLAEIHLPGRPGRRPDFLLRQRCDPRQGAWRDLHVPPVHQQHPD